MIAPCGLTDTPLSCERRPAPADGTADAFGLYRSPIEPKLQLVSSNGLLGGRLPAVHEVFRKEIEQEQKCNAEGGEQSEGVQQSSRRTANVERHTDGKQRR